MKIVLSFNFGFPAGANDDEYFNTLEVQQRTEKAKGNDK